MQQPEMHRSTTWKNWVSIVKKNNILWWHSSMELCLCNTDYTIPLKTSRVSLFKRPFCKVATDPHIMWSWGGGGGGAWSAVGVWVYSYLSRKTITRLISLLSCVMRPLACENNYVNYFFFQHDVDNNNDCNYAMYCCNIAVCRSEAVATLYYTCAHTHARTHAHTLARTLK